jgi:hypothetical protein
MTGLKFESDMSSLDFEMNLVDHEASYMQEWVLVINRW